MFLSFTVDKTLLVICELEA